MSPRPRTHLILLVAILAAPLAASDWNENDGASGADASDAQATATALSSWGSSWGTLHPNDVDWFAAPSPLPQGACVSFSSTATTDSNLMLSAGGRTIKTPSAQGEFTTLTVAAGPGTLVTAGIQAVGDRAARWNAYNLSLRMDSASTLGTPDAGTGTDAGSGLATATPIGFGCASGRLTPLFDTSDVYAFSGVSGTSIIASVTAVSGIPLSVQVLDANGVPVASQMSTSGPLAITLPSSGTFFLSTSSSNLNGATDYVLSLVGPPGPCRPMCTLD